jgi:hypothetical protein
MKDNEPTGETFTLYRPGYMTDTQWEELTDAVADVVAGLEDDWSLSDED